jgi:hypothetical protein
MPGQAIIASASCSAACGKEGRLGRCRIPRGSLRWAKKISPRNRRQTWGFGRNLETGRVTDGPVHNADQDA